MKFNKCSVHKCTKTTGPMFQFPKNQQVLDNWIKFCNRESDWLPNTASRICANHFDEKSLRENNQITRLVKDAVPSINNSINCVTPMNPSATLYLIHEDSTPFVKKIENLEDPPVATTEQIGFFLKHDHPYCRKIVEINAANPSVPLEDYDKLKIELKALKTENRNLKNRIKNYEKCKKRSLKRKVKVKFLTSYQNKLTYENKKTGRKWDKETIKLAIATRAACGPRGYNFLRKNGQPLPSIRFINKKLQPLSFKSGILDEFITFLESASKSMDELDRRAGIFFDEMSIVPGQELDNSSNDVIGNPTFPGDSAKDATHALVFLLCGLRKRWRQLIAYYFTGKFYF